MKNLPLVINPGTLKGVVQAAPSKSAGVRAAAAMALASVSGDFGCLGNSDDVRAAVRAAHEWLAGADTLHVGESALAARIMACAAALRGGETIIAGEGTLLRRDMTTLVDALKQLGVQVEGLKIPLRVIGSLRGGAVTVDGSAGSQVVTGLLMTLPIVPQDSVLRVLNPTSIPYIYMTLDLLAECGIFVAQDGWDFHIKGGQRYVLPPVLTVEGDWSGASCLLTAGDVTVRGLSAESRQADRAIVDALRAAGAEVSFAGDAVSVRRGDMHAFEFDATHCPDLFPALVALATECEGISILHGVSRLADKESSRGTILKREYDKMGIGVTLDGDTMRVWGGVPRGGVTVNSHRDHRIAMSLAVTALRASEPVTLLGADAVNKSYPDFWEDFDSILASS